MPTTMPSPRLNGLAVKIIGGIVVLLVVGAVFGIVNHAGKPAHDVAAEQIQTIKSDVHDINKKVDGLVAGQARIEGLLEGSD